MKSTSIVQVNESYVFREEFDDWALLFNPDSSETFGMNQISSFIYKHLDGANTIESIVNKLAVECSEVPPDVETVVTEFIQNLIDKGLAEVKE